MKSILLTGVTGIIGSELTARHLDRGNIVFTLVRCKNGLEVSQRLPSRFSEAVKAGQLVPIAGDITKHSCGMSFYDFTRLSKAKIDAVVHCAADTRFVETPNKDIWKTNVHGTKNVLELAQLFGGLPVHYMGTVYVCGDAEVFTEKDLDKGQVLRNDYEISKIKAEFYARAYSDVMRIYRLNVVTGSSVDGSIRGFSGFAEFFKFWWAGLRNLILQRYKESPDSLDGIEVGGNIINIPLSIACSSYPLNLAPIDWVTDLAMSLFDCNDAPDHAVFHLTNPKAPLVDYVIRESLNILGFKGVEVGNVTSRSRTNIVEFFQRLIQRSIKSYNPYIKKPSEVFGIEDTVRILERNGKKWIDPPSYDRAMFERLLNYAISKNFKSEE